MNNSKKSLHKPSIGHIQKNICSLTNKELQTAPKLMIYTFYKGVWTYIYRTSSQYPKIRVNLGQRRRIFMYISKSWFQHQVLRMARLNCYRWTKLFQILSNSVLTFVWKWDTIHFVLAEMAELADAHGSGPCGSNTMRVQVPFSAR